MNNINKHWNYIIKSLEKKFKEELSLKGVLYLIGIQELNTDIKKFSKEEKVALLHIATCKILVPFGYYKLSHIDKDGWPHFDEIKALKSLSNQEQEVLIKQAIINYLN